MNYLGRILNIEKNLLFIFRKINWPILILLTVGVHLTFSLIVAFLLNRIGYRADTNFPPFESVKEEFFAVVIFAPFLETFIFQYLLINTTIYVTKLFRKEGSPILAILLPAICFGLAHSYNYIYMAITFVVGLIFNTFYMINKFKRQDAYTNTTIVHGLYNLCVFGFKHI